MSENMDASHEHGDPLVAQAEKILFQRQGRYTTIDADLLGEPGWDILLKVFVENGKGHGCRPDILPEAVFTPPEVTRRWIALLIEREMLAMKGNLLVLTDTAENKMRLLCRAHLRELRYEFARFAQESRSPT